MIDRYVRQNSKIQAVGVYMDKLELRYTGNKLRGVEIPDWLAKNHNIWNPKPNKDNMCFWRSLARYFVGPKARYEDKAIQLFREFYRECNYFNKRSKNFNIKNEEG